MDAVHYRMDTGGKPVSVTLRVTPALAHDVKFLAECVGWPRAVMVRILLSRGRFSGEAAKPPESAFDCQSSGLGAVLRFRLSRGQAAVLEKDRLFVPGWVTKSHHMRLVLLRGARMFALQRYLTAKMRTL